MLVESNLFFFGADGCINAICKKFRSFSSMFCCCFLFQLCLLLHLVCRLLLERLIYYVSYLCSVSVVPCDSYCMPHVCDTLDKLFNLAELYGCLIFLLCCNHVTLMLYYR